MADLQMSSSLSWAGPLFQKISPLDTRYFDFAQQADSDDKATWIALDSSQDAGVLDKICTMPIHGFQHQSLIDICQKLARDLQEE